MGMFDPVALHPGACFQGRYEVVRKLKAGGMGAVYEVIHLETRRRRALKVMLPSVVADPDLRARFKVEATVAADIRSEHIVETFDAGVDAETGTPFLVMELLEGEELGQLLQRRGRLPPGEVVALLGQAALALDRTHAASIVHRDLKPENLFLTRRDDGSPRLKILDFGIAKVVAQGDKTTQAIGTPLYMPREQMRGERSLGPPADLYALAHIAFTLLTGEAYWAHEKRQVDNAFALLILISEGMREAPSARAAQRSVALPPAFDAWFARATALQPTERYARAGDQIADLGRALGIPSAPSAAALDPTPLQPAPSAPSYAALPPAHAGPTPVVSGTSAAVALPLTAPGPRGAGRAVVALASVAAALVLLGLGGWALVGYTLNNELARKADAIASPVSAEDYHDWSDVDAKLGKLDALREQIEALRTYQKSPPVAYRALSSVRDEALARAITRYRASIDRGLARPAQEVLEVRLTQVIGLRYIEDYQTLKTYLLLNDRVRLADHAGWEKERLTQLWAEALRRSAVDLAEADIKARLGPHVSLYVELLASGEMAGPTLALALIENVRDRLTRVGPAQRYYDQFVTVLADQKLDASGPAVPENLRYPPVTLPSIFADRPEVLTRLRSAQKDRTGEWARVEGPYTAKAHEQVLAALDEGRDLLAREKWVVPPTLDEEKVDDRAQKKALERVRQDYDAAYLAQWVRFFRDLTIDPPKKPADLLVTLRILSTPDWPYQRLLRLLADHTQFEDPRARAEATPDAVDGGVLDQIRERTKRRLEAKARAAAARVDPVPDHFRSMVRFGVAEGPAAPAPPLAAYIDALVQLVTELQAMRDRPSAADTLRTTAAADAALKQARALLFKTDATGQELLTPLLLPPLLGVVRAAPTGALAAPRSR